MRTPNRIAATTNRDRRSARQPGADRYSSFISDSELFQRSLKDPIAADIVRSAAFERLKDISFLGAISYVRRADPRPAITRQSRYFHSLGVAKVAESFAEGQHLTRHDRLTVVAAALLHDIGHPPFSHSAESAFEARFGENHHSLTMRIIRGQERIFKDVSRVLRVHGVDPEEVVALLDGQSLVRGLDLFKGPFNLDTLEGISRCSVYMKGSFSESLPSPELVLDAAIDLFQPDSVAVLDCFWRMKDTIYNSLIRNNIGILADKIVNDYFRKYRGKLSRDIMLASESGLLERHRKVFERLYEFDTSDNRSRKIEYIKRSFIVDERFSALDLNHRYTHRDARAVLYY